jgi:hypothetical protein
MYIQFCRITTGFYGVQLDYLVFNLPGVLLSSLLALLNTHGAHGPDAVEDFGARVGFPQQIAGTVLC